MIQSVTEHDYCSLQQAAFPLVCYGLLSSPVEQVTQSQSMFQLTVNQEWETTVTVTVTE